MKVICELEKKIDPIEGEDETKMPTLRKIIQLVISQSKAKTADDARRIARVVPKIKSDSEAELSDEEFRTLKGLAEANQANLSAYVQGFLLESLEPSKVK